MRRRRLRRNDDELLQSESTLLPSHQEKKPAEQTAAKTGAPADALMQLQRTRGNRYVQKMLDESPPAAVQRATYGSEDAAALKPAFVENHDALQDTEKICKTLLPTGLFALFKQKARQEQDAQPPTEQSLKQTIATYAKYRLRNEPAIFEFKDEHGRFTKGEHEPEALTDKVEEAVTKRVKNLKGWHLLGLSIMDAERSVLLAVDNRNPDARRLYWIDPVEGGFKDVTGRLDERITQLTRDLWHAQPPDRRRRTRVCFWPFVPA